MSSRDHHTPRYSSGDSSPHHSHSDRTRPVRSTGGGGRATDSDLNQTTTDSDRRMTTTDSERQLKSADFSSEEESYSDLNDSDSPRSELFSLSSHSESDPQMMSPRRQKDSDESDSDSDKVPQSLCGTLGSFLYRNFLIIGIVGFSVFGFLYPSPGQALDDGPTFYIVIAVIFFISGLKLQTSELRDTLRNWPIIIFGVLLILAITPMASFPLVEMPFLDPPEFAIGLAVHANMPTTLVAGVVYTREAKGNITLALVLSVITNMLSPLTVPFMLAFTLQNSRTQSSGNVDIDTVAMLIQLLEIVLAPLVVGKLVHTLIAPVRRFVAAYPHILRIVTGLCIMTVPWMKVSASVDMLRQVQPIDLLIIVGVGFALHTFFLIVHWLVCVVFRIDIAERKAVVLMCSEKTLTTAFVVVGTFPPDIAGLIAVPVITTHLIQLTQDAIIASKWRTWSKSSKSSTAADSDSSKGSPRKKRRHHHRRPFARDGTDFGSRGDGGSSRGSAAHFAQFGRPLLNPNDDGETSEESSSYYSHHAHRHHSHRHHAHQHQNQYYAHHGHGVRQRARSASENDIDASSLSVYSPAFKLSADSRERLYAHDASYVPEQQPPPPDSQQHQHQPKLPRGNNASLSHTEEHSSLRRDRRAAQAQQSANTGEGVDRANAEGSDASQNTPSATTRRSTKSTATTQTRTRSRLGRILDSLRSAMDLPRAFTSRSSRYEGESHYSQVSTGTGPVHYPSSAPERSHTFSGGVASTSGGGQSHSRRKHRNSVSDAPASAAAGAGSRSHSRVGSFRGAQETIVIGESERDHTPVAFHSASQHKDATRGARRASLDGERQHLLVRSHAHNGRTSINDLPETASSTPPSPTSQSRHMSPSSSHSYAHSRRFSSSTSNELYFDFEDAHHGQHQQPPLMPAVSRSSFSAARVGVRNPSEYVDDGADGSVGVMNLGAFMRLGGGGHTAVNHADARTDYAPTHIHNHWGVSYRRDSEPCIYVKAHDAASVRTL